MSQVEPGALPWRAIGIGPVHDDSIQLPNVAAALVAEGLRRAGVPDEFAMSLTVVTILQPLGPPVVRLRFPLDLATHDMPVLTHEARETLAPLTRPTMRVKIEQGFEKPMVVEPLFLPPETIDRSADPMTALRATRVMAALDVPHEIVSQQAIASIRELLRTGERP